jgi:hypothetical protein
MSDEGLGALLALDLIVPIRSSSGGPVDAARVPIEGMRHGSDEQGRFLAAYTSPENYIQYGPPGSDAVELPARDLFARAEAAGDRVVIDPGSPAQVEVPTAVLPFLAAGIDPVTPEAMRARRPFGELPPLEAPSELPEPFATELRGQLAELHQVRAAWLLRAGTGWTVGVQLAEEAAPLAGPAGAAGVGPGGGHDAGLAAFDEVRNRLHALAAAHLGGRRALAVTDLSAQPVREAYESAAPPMYVRAGEKPRGILGRLRRE